MFNSTE